MFKKVFYLFVVLFIGFCAAKVFAFDLNENSPDFSNRLAACQPYTEITNIRFYNEMYTLKKELLGSNYGKCLYKETWTNHNSNKSKTITCQLHLTK